MINISIIDDTVVEDPEMFNLLLSSTDPSVTILNNQSTVLILDDNLNDSEFCFMSLVPPIYYILPYYPG